MDITTKLATVRFLAAHKRPYFATALFAMHLVPTTQVDTMAVDKYGRVYINPGRIGEGTKVKAGEWTVDQCAAVLVHELGHWLRKHHERAEHMLAQAALDDVEQARRSANICQDAELNDDLEGNGLTLPDEAVTPKKFGWPDGRLWEEYYQMLQKSPPHPGSSSGKTKGGKASSGGTATMGPPEKCDCGSGAHGQSRGYELPPPATGKAPGLGEAEGDLLRQDVAAQIQAAASRAPGTVPAGWKRWAEAVLEPPVVPWQRELSALVKNAATMARGATDYTYTKVSRRGAFAGVLMPALIRPEPTASVVLDTSGSMGGDLLAAALREVEGILRAIGQRRVPVLCCDAAVHGGVQQVSSALQIELAGGGGTDMGVGIEAAQKLRSNVIIVLTDGATPWPASAPRGCQLVVGILDPPVGAEKTFAVPAYAKRVLFIRDPKQKVAA